MSRGYDPQDQQNAQSLSTVQSHINKLRLSNEQRKNNILRQTFAMQGPATGPAQGKLPFYLAPGNVGDLNMMIWPFFYTTTYCEVSPGQVVANGITNTLEAAYVITEMTKVVFLLTDDPVSGLPVYTYIDPSDPRDLGFAPGLSLDFQDTTSSRQFVGPFGSFNLDAIGSPQWPTKLPSPQMIAPTANMAINFSLGANFVPNGIYVPFVTFFGYKMRISELNNAGTQRTLAYDPSGAFNQLGG